MLTSSREAGAYGPRLAASRVLGFILLVLSQYVETSFALRLVADGAGGMGYLLKDRVDDLEDFADAVRRIARGGSVIDPEVVTQLVGRRRARPDRRPHRARA